MTQKKKLKHAIRERAAQSGTSYSTARRAMAVTPPTPAAPSIAQESSRADVVVEETLPRQLTQSTYNETITLHFSAHSMAAMAATWIPLFTVAYAIPGVKARGVVDLEVDKPTPLVFCRKTPKDDSCYRAFNRAVGDYPELDWVETSAIKNGAMPGKEPPYAAVMLTRRRDGIIELDDRIRLLNSLHDLLRDSSRPEGDSPEVSSK